MGLRELRIKRLEKGIVSKRVWIEKVEGFINKDLVLLRRLKSEQKKKLKKVLII